MIELGCRIYHCRRRTIRIFVGIEMTLFPAKGKTLEGKNRISMNQQNIFKGRKQILLLLCGPRSSLLKNILDLEEWTKKESRV